MDLHLKLEQNKKYFCVESSHSSGITDLSIFTDEEWIFFLEMSNKFEDEYYKCGEYTIWEYEQLSQEILDSIYFLKYKCEFCNVGFNDLPQKFGNKVEILEYVLEILKDSSLGGVSIDKFREWLIKNRLEMEQKFKNLKDE